MIKLHNDDNRNVMRSMEDSSIDLTVTSPPYDNLRTYNDIISSWNESVWKDIISELYRLTKPGGVVVWVVADATVNGSETGTSFKQALWAKECGFNLHDTMIYHKDNPAPVGGHNRYYQSFEYMFILSKGKPNLNPITIKRRNKWNDKRTERHRGVTRNKDGEFIKKIVKVKDFVKKQNLWTYVVSGGTSSKDKEAHKHPAIFPEQLAHDHIVSWSNEGDVVFDPFMGSGTTGKMAKLSNRNFIGVELDSTYFLIAEDRIGKANALF